MAHPYSKQAEETHRSKRGTMGKESNLVIPMMKKAHENRKGGVHESHSKMQHKSQSAAHGMKRGGHVGKPRHHKPKLAMVAPTGDMANPSPPDPALAAAGAGSSPAPAPMMPPGAMPPAKRGGRMHSDVVEDKALIKKMVKPTAIKRKEGGSVMNKWQTAGIGSGEGRLQLEAATKRKSGLRPIKG